MSTQVVRIESYAKGSLTAIGNECDRKEGVKHRNSDIDPTRSHLNHSYKDCDFGFYSEFYQLLAMNNCEFREKKNSVAFEGMIITADLKFFEKMGYSYGKKPTKNVRGFFDNAYKWALGQIGYNGTDKNVLSAKVHYDEKTPHLHIYYLPMTDRWQEKIYAKDENGKILRSSKGTPIQAKDEKGKTLYNQVESPTPKLSRAEFWRNKGAQNSYRIMQDDFQACVGKIYSLERGEIGSTRKHETKHQYKKRKLDDEIKPLQNLKAKTEKIKENKTQIPLIGKTMVTTKEWERTTRQAQAYCVNRDEIKENRQDRAKINAEIAKIEQEKKRLETLRIESEKAYNRQLQVNQLLERTERELECANEKNRNAERKQNQLEKTCQNQAKMIEVLQTAFTDTTQAVGILKHGKKGGYKIENLTEQQERLIDSIGNHSAALMKRQGRVDLADNINKTVRICASIEQEIDRLTPQVSYEYNAPCR
ncbi:MAG: plasmid recombination protein [Oscillospiraceae bacterium]|jgi:hypothetical protein|nr:plasmid recombination protein [Oscillospiraceae bacterium]